MLVGVQGKLPALIGEVLAELVAVGFLKEEMAMDIITRALVNICSDTEPERFLVSLAVLYLRLSVYHGCSSFPMHPVAMTQCRQLIPKLLSEVRFP